MNKKWIKVDMDLEIAQKQVSEYAMAFDLLAKMTHSSTEKEAIENILQLCIILFSPQKLFYASLKKGQPEQIYSSSGLVKDDIAIKCRLSNFEKKYAWTASSKGFLVKINYDDKPLGILEVDEISFPEYKEHYLNLTMSIVNVCGLTIENAKRYQIIKDAEKKVRKEKEKLEKAMSEIKTLSGLLPICASCKKIRDDKGYWNQIEGYIQKNSAAKFSHSICPNCSDKLYGKEDWYIEMKNE